MDTNENLPIPEQQGEKTRITTHFSAMYVGAVPPPEILDTYERHLPGATERFLAMVENEQRMQFALANRNLDIRDDETKIAATNYRLGLAASFALMLILFVFMFICAYRGLENALMYALSVPVLTALGAIINQFIWKRKK